MTDHELRGWISADRSHGVRINSGILNDIASEVLRLRARLSIADEMASAAHAAIEAPQSGAAMAFLENRLAAYRTA